MSTENPYSLSQKDLAKYHRQKCINILEKITKSCFRMFRDQSTTEEQFVKRFFVLKEKLDALGDVYLDTAYHTEMKKYVMTLWNTLQWHINLEKMRAPHMTQLNRLQKLRKATSYKKMKYKKWTAEIDMV